MHIVHFFHALSSRAHQTRIMNTTVCERTEAHLYRYRHGKLLALNVHHQHGDLHHNYTVSHESNPCERYGTWVTEDMPVFRGPEALPNCERPQKPIQMFKVYLVFSAIRSTTKEYITVSTRNVVAPMTCNAT